MKTYSGKCEGRFGITVVTVSDGKNTKILDYAGSGSARLAFAILLDVHPERGQEWAEEVYQAFKFKMIVSLGNTWILTEKDIDEALGEIPCIECGIPGCTSRNLHGSDFANQKE